MQDHKHVSYKNHFLIAMPHMADPQFSQTITFICDHTPDGALGIVVNRPLELCQSDLFDHLEIDIDSATANTTPVFAGGPVQADRGFILHKSDSTWAHTVPVNEALSLTTSKDILEAIAQGNGPEEHLIALGYAGWGAQQLDEEITENAWLTIPADDTLIFSAPVADRWQIATESLGFEINQLSSVAGHA